MSALTWGALSFFLVVLVAGSATVAGFGFVLWRRLKMTLATGSEVMDELATKMEVLDARVARVEGRTTELERAAGRLSGSFARARVLLGTAQESRDAIAGWLRFVPRG